MMNKARIKELLESMGLEVAVYDGDNYCGEGFDFDGFEFFAELIVKECMGLCEKQEYDYWRSSEDQDFTPIDCADAIKEHFGVE
jgi:hypothetical protein